MVSNEAINTYGAALRSVANKQFLLNPKYQEQQWRANREGAHPKILEFSDAMVKRMGQLGVPMFPHCIVRTPEEQDAAYALGHSRIKGSEPYPHRFAAVDLIHSVKAWGMDVRVWDIIGHVGFEVAKKLSIPITWGGDWDGDGDKTDQSLYDPAHWELAFWRGMEPVAPFMHRMGRKP